MLQNSFIKNRSGQINLISFYCQKGLINQGNATNMVDDKLSHALLVDKVKRCGLENSTIRQIWNWLNGWMVNDLMSTWKTLYGGNDEGSVLGPMLFC